MNRAIAMAAAAALVAAGCGGHDRDHDAVGQQAAAPVQSNTNPVVIPGTPNPGPPAPSPPPTNPGFVQDAPMHLPRTDHTATLLTDGRVLVVGGSVTFVGQDAHSESEIYDAGVWTRTVDPLLGGPLNGLMWTGTPGQSQQSARYDHTATLLPNGKVLIAGGFGTERVDANGQPIYEELASAFLFDPLTNTFSPTANSLTQERRNHQAVLLTSGLVLLAGGHASSIGAGGGTTAIAELYDPATNRFRLAGTTMHESREVHTLTALPGGDALVHGGHSLGGPNGVVQTLQSEHYVAAGVFAQVQVAASPRRHHTAHPLPNGEALIVAGEWPGLGEERSLTTYDPVLRQFRSAGNLLDGRLAHDSALGGNGTWVLVVGGGRESGGTIVPVGKSELFDLATRTSQRFSLTVDRFTGHTVTLLDTGDVLVTGGLRASGTQFLFQSNADVERFSPP